jgi:hypothetical protein
VEAECGTGRQENVEQETVALENGRTSNKRDTEFKSEVEQKVDRRSAGSGSTYNG